MNNEEFSLCVQCMDWAQWYFMTKHKHLMVERYDKRTKTVQLVAPVVHVGNEGQMSAKHGAQTNRIGRRAGFPDYLIPIPRKGFGGLYIEVKKPGGKVTDRNQKNWIEFLSLCNLCVMVNSFEGFKNTIEEYFK